MDRYGADTALVVVDVQNDFADPGGNLYVQGSDEALPSINAEIADARAAGSIVAFTQDWHPESTPHFQKDGGLWPVHCVRGTWGAQLHPDLANEAGDPVVRKGTLGEDGYSGFSSTNLNTGARVPTELEAVLRDAGVRRVVVVGLATDYCVKATALDAGSKGFEALVVAAATRAVNLLPGDGAGAIEEMQKAGVVIE